MVKALKELQRTFELKKKLPSYKQRVEAKLEQVVSLKKKKFFASKKIKKYEEDYQMELWKDYLPALLETEGYEIEMREFLQHKHDFQSDESETEEQAIE